jgi:hypothetical protein
MDLVGMQVRENMRNLKLTVLHRPGGIWSNVDVSRLANGLMTEVYNHPKHPEHLILFGHYSKEQTLEALLGGMAYTATQLVGLNNEALPFKPPCF